MGIGQSFSVCLSRYDVAGVNQSWSDVFFLFIEKTCLLFIPCTTTMMGPVFLHFHSASIVSVSFFGFLGDGFIFDEFRRRASSRSFDIASMRNFLSFISFFACLHVPCLSFPWLSFLFFEAYFLSLVFLVSSRFPSYSPLFPERLWYYTVPSGKTLEILDRVVSEAEHHSAVGGSLLDLIHKLSVVLGR